jgi:serine/threonine protein kinase/tetratricopeptide (TPR) repeat protein
MSDERWVRIDRLLQSALERPPGDREGFIRDTCKDDDELRDEVLSLLAHAGSADRFLEPLPKREPLQPGARLGAYEIRAQIGEGGMGEVYRAHDSKLRRDIALKILPPEAADAERRHRFAREAQAVAALNHPGIVTIHSVEQSGPSTGSGQATIHFLTMELVDGQTLDVLMPAGGFPIDRLLTLAIPLADAVGAAHTQGIVHRDLKPANVMVTRDGRVKVMDFGLAKLSRRATLQNVKDANDASVTTLAGRLTEDGRIFGTVAYMSPEQAEGRDVDHRSDVFSLGILLFELATGRRPFRGDSQVAVLASIVKDTPPPVTDLKPGLPAAFARLVRKCLAKDPARRYQSVLDVRNDLEEINEDLERPQAAAPQASRRRRWLLPVVAAAGAMIAIAAVVYFVPSARHLFWAAPPLDKSKFVITIFRNETNDPSLDPLGLRIRDQIAAGLDGLGGLSATRIDDSSINVDAARRIAERAGVGRVVGGTYYLAGDNIRVDVNVREAGTDEKAYPFLPIDGPRADPGIVVAKVVSHLNGAVAADKDEDWNGRQARIRPMPYDSWLEVRRFRQTGENTLEHLLKARELAPEAFLPKLLLYNRYVRAGRAQDADTMAKELDQIYAQQTDVSRAVTRLYRADAEGNLPKVLAESEVLAKIDLYEFIPLGVLGASQTRMHHLNAAKETYRRRLDLAIPMEPGSQSERRTERAATMAILAEIHHELGNFQAQLDEAKLGEREFREFPVFFVQEASALVGLGRPLSEIEGVIGRARASGKFVSSGQAEMASMLAVVAGELRAHGHQSEAISLAKRAIQEIQNEIAGTAEPTPTQLVVHRRALMQAEHWQTAYAEFSAVVKAAPDNLTANGNLGVIAAALGRKAEALNTADVLRKVNARYTRGKQHYQRARVLAALGAADAAVGALKQSFADGYGWIPGEIHRDNAFDPIRENADFKEFCAPKDSPASTLAAPESTFTLWPRFGWLAALVALVAALGWATVRRLPARRARELKR